MNISYSIPAYLSDFSVADNRRTIAKLKMFYVGETADGRVFDKEFANKLVESLPDTPVVAFYSDLKDDFIGHNSTQYIYGHVSHSCNSGFEVDEKGVEWFTTEVLLYTDRIDNIGEVAKKIVGHPQSLEMDPNTVKYEVFKENGKTKIAFKEAQLAGLSVLGTEQKPAFTGSEFFIDQKDMRERFENFFSCLEQKDRGASMENKEKFVELLNFLKLSYDEKRKMVCNYVQTQLGDDVQVFIPEMFDDYCVIGVFDFKTWNESYSMYDYSISEQGVELSNERKCLRRFVAVEDIEKLDNAKAEDKKKESKCEETDGSNFENKEEENKSDVTPEQGDNDENSKDENKEENFSSNPSTLSDSEREELENFRSKETEVNNQIAELEAKIKDYETQVTEYSAKVTEYETKVSNYEVEHQELENFRLERKVNLVNSYKDELDAETIQSFVEMANTVSYDELEAKLAIEYRKISKNIKSNNVAFSFNASMFENNNKNNSTESNDYVSLVNRYSKK